MRRNVFCRCIAVLAFCLSAPGFAGPFSNVYVLGDSLSDQGNLFIATSLLGGAANALPASDHYFNGRFSNGPIYLDVLAQRLEVTIAPSLLGGTNFAFGGARTTYNTVEQIVGGPFPNNAFPWSLNAEVGAFKASGVQDPGGLFIVFSGSNDIGDILARGLNPATVIPTTVGGIVNAISAFKDAGARTIVVPNVPDLGLTPAFRVNPVVSGIATTLSQQYNAILHTALDTISGVNIIEFDTFALTRNVTANPAAFGLTNVTTPCYSGFVAPNPAGTECANPGQTFFWDLIHPTSVVHGILAEAIFASGLPLPSTLPLLLLALLALAAVKIRRPGEHE